MAIGNYVAYYRVSIAKRGASGLDLNAQRIAVRSCLNEGPWNLVAEFIEDESGKTISRVQLGQAIAACRLCDATLVIAKLDRLSRNSGFLLSLRDAGVDFIATDVPSANRLTVGLMAKVAAKEREARSARTKAAMAAAKARGVKFGGDRGARFTVEQRAARSAFLAQRAAARAADLAPVLSALKAEGVTSMGAIARALTERRIPTAQGAIKWSPMQVSRVLKILT